MREGYSISHNLSPIILRKTLSKTPKLWFEILLCFKVPENQLTEYKKTEWFLYIIVMDCTSVLFKERMGILEAFYVITTATCSSPQTVSF